MRFAYVRVCFYPVCVCVCVCVDIRMYVFDIYLYIYILRVVCVCRKVQVHSIKVSFLDHLLFSLLSLSSFSFLFSFLGVGFQPKLA